MNEVRQVRIDVAGDVCLDLVGIPIPPPPGNPAAQDNWRLTGETRTHYLLGGAMLLTQWIETAAAGAVVRGMRPQLVEGLVLLDSAGKPKKKVGDELSTAEFLQIAERLKRDEVVHSLLALDLFRATPSSKTKDHIRVDVKHGFSGPPEGEPKLQLLPPDTAAGPADIIVLDDTGNRFRRAHKQWPSSLSSADALVVYKLHRPLPAAVAASTAASGGSRPPSITTTMTTYGRPSRVDRSTAGSSSFRSTTCAAWMRQLAADSPGSGRPSIWSGNC
jgi:hypothetical protein